MFVDTHCHLTLLDLSPYQGDLDQALAQAREAGVSKFMSISVDLDDHIILAEIAKRHDDVGYTVGVHPCEDPNSMARATTDYLIELAQAEKVWALGETGLDYFHSTDFVEEQKTCFARHIHASQAVKKPVVVHTVLQNRTLLILFVRKNLHMVFCIVLPKTGKLQKRCLIVAIMCHFLALFHLKMRKLYVMLPSKCL